MLGSIFGIVLVAGTMVFIEVPALVRKKQKKELWVFFLFLILGTGLSIAQLLRMRIPNPLDWLTSIYKPLSDVIDNVLK
ncbi:hypothetical protein DFP93_11853 [Aneurinibacillus soli]|uniref:Uncharacterized protein n=1 Tax=Aneurinibacillus soli TaxID=1500254 RepID=A0A0U5C4P0_9BACL|nr:hypothetical protein [Aneurinibacillus soli]PYE59303.1 hypothetical protein DFP93_11853 [Aneurinibacillus soli]BAU26707.1 hypothetical protein CB4_00850 [Aneurinibacillus soli]